jgi:hypothetical protein
MNFEEGKKPKTNNNKNQGTSKPEASQQFENGDIASEWEELVELDDVQLATIVGGLLLPAVQAAREAARRR